MTASFGHNAPTKDFYAAPEYHDIQTDNIEAVIVAEIYTIGIIMLSLLGLLFEKNCDVSSCGIIYYIRKIEADTRSHKLSEYYKDRYLLYILVNVFRGDENNKFYRILKKMTQTSPILRAKSYSEVSEKLKIVRAELYE